MPGSGGDRSRRYAAALLAGLALALFDLFVAPRFVDGGSAGSFVERAGCVALLLAVGLVGALMLELLRGPAALLLPGLVAWRLGGELAAGRRAAAMPLASSWDVIAGLATTVFGLLTWRRSRSSARLAWFASLIVAGLAVSALSCAAIVERGRYHEVRAAVAALSGMALYPFLYRALPPRPTRWAVGLATVALLTAPAGIWIATTRPAAANWAIDRSVATAPIVRELRVHFAAAIDDGDFETYRLPPFFGTRLATESLARVEADGGPLRGLLFVTIDALRADMVGRKVQGESLTPFLDRMSREGFVFERAYAPAPGTHLSFLGFLSGHYPSQFLTGSDPLNEFPLVTDRLGSHGVITRGCYPKGGLTLEPKSFRRHALGFAESSLHHWDDPPADETFASLAPADGDRAWFSYWHIMLPHYPYDDAPKDRRFGDDELSMYQSELREADRRLGEMVDRLRASGALDRAWVVIAADHGEEFGEHGATRHGTQLYEESVHVPLIAFGPGIRPGRHDGPVSLIDLAPTLEHLFSLPAEGRPSYPGRSWTPLLVGLADPDRNDAVLIENPPVGSGRWNVRSAIATSDHKLVVDERTKRLFLYDLVADPAEKIDLAAEDESLARKLWRRLEGIRRASGSDATPSAFDALEGLDELFLAAEELGPGAILGQMRFMRRLPDAFVVRYLQYFVFDYRDPVAIADLRSRLTNHPSREIQLALEVVDDALEPSLRADRLLEILAAAATTELRAMIWRHAALASAGANPRISAIATENSPVDLDESLAQAEWLGRRGGRVPAVELLKRGLESGSPWFGFRVARLVQQFGGEGLLNDLFDAHARLTEPMARTEIMRAIGCFDDPRISLFLRERARRGHAFERTAAFTTFALRRNPKDGVVSLSCGDDDQLERCGGLKRVDAFFAAMTETTATLPIELSDAGTLLALFIQFPTREPPNRLVLEVGAWQRTITRAPFHPTLPLLFLLPSGTSAGMLTIHAPEAAIAEVRVGGVITLAADATTLPLED